MKCNGRYRELKESAEKNRVLVGFVLCKKSRKNRRFLLFAFWKKNTISTSGSALSVPRIAPKNPKKRVVQKLHSFNYLRDQRSERQMDKNEISNFAHLKTFSFIFVFQFQDGGFFCDPVSDGLWDSLTCFANTAVRESRPEFRIPDMFLVSRRIVPE